MDIHFVSDYQVLAESKIPSSNLCSRSYELVQERENLDLSNYFLLIRSSGSQTQGKFLVLQCVSRTLDWSLDYWRFD